MNRDVRRGLIAFTLLLPLVFLVLMTVPRALLFHEATGIFMDALYIELPRATSDAPTEDLLDDAQLFLVGEIQGAINGRLALADTGVLEACVLNAGPAKVPWLPWQGVLPSVGNFYLQCNYQYPSLLGLSALLAGAFAALVMLLGHQWVPVSKEWLKQLVDKGETFDEALEDVRVLGESRLKCFSLALEQWGRDEARRFSLAQDGLTIDLAKSMVAIRDHQFEMARTPLFYYAWYAYQRQQGEGWYANPATNRGHETDGQLLAELMKNYGGHARAIKELESHGIRSKVLDQNRSKIKDALVEQFGETLAADYLFESDGYQSTGRTRYRIIAAGGQISLHDPRGVFALGDDENADLSLQPLQHA